MTRRPDTGDRGIVLLVKSDQEALEATRSALRRLLTKHDGNGTRAALELGLATAQPLMATVDALGLRGWLEEVRNGPKQ
jgi:hypothetical protein